MTRLCGLAVIPVVSLLLLAGCDKPDGPAGNNGQVGSGDALLESQLALHRITRDYAREVREGTRAVAVVTITRTKTYASQIPGRSALQCFFRAVDVLRPGSDEKGNSLWDYPWFVHQPGDWAKEEEILNVDATYLVVINFGIKHYPVTERVMPVPGPEDPRVQELAAWLTES